MQVQVLSSGNIIADAEIEKTATGDGAADYKGWLAEAGVSGGDGPQRKRILETLA